MTAGPSIVTPGDTSSRLHTATSRQPPESQILRLPTGWPLSRASAALACGLGQAADCRGAQRHDLDGRTRIGIGEALAVEIVEVADQHRQRAPHRAGASATAPSARRPGPCSACRQRARSDGRSAGMASASSLARASGNEAFEPCGQIAPRFSGVASRTRERTRSCIRSECRMP